MKKRLWTSVGFLVVLMYLSMGNMMWGWPVPAFMDGNHVAMGLAQLLLTVIIMVINQKFFISGFKGLIHRAPNMDTLLNITNGGSVVECPVCGIEGDLTVEDGKVRVTFSDAQRKRSRLHWDGKLEHSTEIKTRAVGPGQIPNLKELLKAYQWE